MKELFTALASAQAEMEAATKDSNNPFFKSKYADLNSVMGAVKPALARHGLAFIQICHDAENCAKVETVIVHKSGEQFMCGAVSVPVSKVDAQGYGSALTYARRYSLSSAFGVGAEDDDGNAAAKAMPVKMTAEREETWRTSIKSQTTKAQAKAVWKEAIAECSALNDVEAGKRLKASLIVTAAALDAAEEGAE